MEITLGNFGTKVTQSDSLLSDHSGFCVVNTPKGRIQGNGHVVMMQVKYDDLWARSMRFQ